MGKEPMENVSTPDEGGALLPFEQVYGEYSFHVFRFIYNHIGNRQEAEDLTSEVFLYCYKNYARYDPLKSSISTWLFLIAKSMLKTYYRDKKTNLDISDFEDWLLTDGDNLSKSVYLSQLRSFLAEQIKLLPEKQQQVLIMRFFYEKDFEEIASSLNTSAGNVRVILTRAVAAEFRRFKTRLECLTMAQLYRKSALEKISSPEQLDKALTVTSAMSWIVLIAITLILVVTIVWSIIGTIPVTVTTNGIVASPVSTNAVYTPESGSLTSVLVYPGSELRIGDPIASYKTGNGDVKTIYSDQVGTVTEVLVKSGDTITQGNEVIRVSPKANSSQVIVCYVKLSDAKKIERGMQVSISLSSAESQTYGHMLARVINIDSYVSSSKGMSYVLGTDNNLAATFQKDGAAVVAVTCELYPDSSTSSGYYWSNEKGSKLDVTNGSLVSAKVVVEEVRPITKLFAKLKEIWGD